MFCPKCGTRIDEDSTFCPNCGSSVEAYKVEDNNQEKAPLLVSDNKETMTEIISKKSNAVLNPIKSFVSKHKKKLLICIIFIVLIFALVFAYGKLFGFEKLEWDKKYEDYKLEYVTQNKLKLGIKFSDKENIDKLKVKTTCGKHEINNLEIEWDLTEALGKCNIEVSYKQKKISKKFTVISPNISENELGYAVEIDLDSDEDLDLDGLTNKQEKEYKTDPELSDTDMDGLDDKYEIFTSKTDPLKKDSDEDELDDYNEIELGLDPLKKDSKGDGISDGQRSVSYVVKNESLNITLDIAGKGNLATSTIDTFTNSTFSSMDGLLDTVYNFYTDGKIESAKVTIPYSLEELKAKGLSEENLTLYYFDEQTKELEEMPTTIDKENKKVVVELKHFSKYVLGDKNVVLPTVNNQILMVIDNSVSMYTYDQLRDLGYTDITGADGNDSAFKRLTLTNNLIDMFTGSYYFGISEFAGQYVRLSNFTKDKDSSKSAVNSIKNDVGTVGSGTYIIDALNSGINEFEVDDQGHYLILLTDGKDTSQYTTFSESKGAIISNAKEKNIKICVIGLGSSIDTDDLDEIAEKTGCDYYNANAANALDEIYSNIGADINYNLVDVDGDGNVDGTVIADSGFVVNRDGFPFDNYSTNFDKDGHCYGIATFVELYYSNKLPLTLGKKSTNSLIKDSYPYDLRNTYFDGSNNLYDYKLKTNMLKYAFSLGGILVGEEAPKDLKTLSNNVLVYSKKYRDEIENSGLYDINVVVSTASDEAKLKKWGVVYKKYETPLLNEEKMQSSNTIDNEDKQLLNAIYAMHIKQYASTYYSSALNFVLVVDKIFDSSSAYKLDSATFIEVLKTRLNAKEVPVISSMYDSGNHSINAISLVQDNKDSNHYYIGVYDSNHPGEKRYVDITCNKNSCVTMANKYYSNSKKAIKFNISLAEELSYFN